MTHAQDPRIDPSLVARRDVERLPAGLFEWRIAEVASIQASRHARESSPQPTNLRWQDDIITREIQPGARVLDLGCGDGQLLERLQRDRQVRGQ